MVRETAPRFPAVVSQRISSLPRRRLTSRGGRGGVISTWYGRLCRGGYLFDLFPWLSQFFLVSLIGRGTEHCQHILANKTRNPLEKQPCTCLGQLTCVIEFNILLFLHCEGTAISSSFENVHNMFLHAYPMKVSVCLNFRHPWTRYGQSLRKTKKCTA